MEATSDPTTVSIPARLDFDAEAGGFAKAMAHLEHVSGKELDAAGIEPALRELVRLRASQLNGCAYCVDMHTKDARVGGEDGLRLAAVPVWREAPFFTARERAALAFTESVTLMAQTHVPDEDYAAVEAQFEPNEIAALVCLITMINAWNTVGVSTRTWEVGSYQP
jgi:AhpD family alkylhydroperoxidase